MERWHQRRQNIHEEHVDDVVSNRQRPGQCDFLIFIFKYQLIEEHVQYIINTPLLLYHEGFTFYSLLIHVNFKVLMAAILGFSARGQCGMTNHLCDL